MAKFANYEEEAAAAAGEYVKPELLFNDSIVFNITGAGVVDTPFRDNVTGEIREGVEFTIEFEEDGDLVEKKFTLGANPARMWYVQFFEDHSGEKLEDVEMVKLKSTGKGNPPWGFKSAKR